MFLGASSFNGDNISLWNTSSVRDVSSMFFSAAAFNGNIAAWDTSNVTNMKNMFVHASVFKGNISGA
jgi:surface protein